MKYFALILFFSFSFASAYTPVLVSQDSLLDITEIIDPEISRTYYGALDNFPHTYIVTSGTPFELFVQVLIPDGATYTNNVSGIIIKEIPGSGRVEEVARLRAKDASWERVRTAGDWYRKGSSFDASVEAGTYRIEVSTPDNIEKYVLTVGATESKEGVGYFERVRSIIAVKVFLGKSRLRVIESPYVFIPLLTLMSVAFLVWYRYRNIGEIRGEENTEQEVDRIQ